MDSQPKPVLLPKPPFNWNLVLIGIIVLLFILLGVSFYQILSLRREVDTLKATTPKSPPTPIITGAVTGVISPAPSVSPNQPIEVIGLIQYSDLEGGCWYIQPEVPECKEDNCPSSVTGMPANYEPTNLPKELQRTGLKAKFKLEIQSGVATICQIGPTVKILDYQIIK